MDDACCTAVGVPQYPQPLHASTHVIAFPWSGKPYSYLSCQELDTTEVLMAESQNDLPKTVTPMPAALADEAQVDRLQRGVSCPGAWWSQSVTKMWAADPVGTAALRAHRLPSRNTRPLPGPTVFSRVPGG